MAGWDFEEYGKIYLSSNQVHWKLQYARSIPKEYLVKSPKFQYEGLNWHLILILSNHIPSLKDWVGIEIVPIPYRTHDKLQNFSARVGIIDINGMEYWNVEVFPVPYQHHLSYQRNLLLPYSDLRSNEHIFFELKKKASTNFALSQDVDNTNGIPKLQLDLKELMLNGEYSDVIIKVQQQVFNCHRCILAARSEVFNAMMDKNITENKCVINVDDTQPDVFQSFLRYLYTGDVELLHRESVMKLEKLADKYGIHDLKCLCAKVIKS